jgi:hypothetical protein
MTALVLVSATLAYGADCGSAPLPTYLNGGSLFVCTEDAGQINIEFNNTTLPSYAGLALLATGGTADPANIGVVPGLTSLDFDSDTFHNSSPVASGQAELVHFSVFSNGPSLLSGTFSLHNPQVSTGDLQLGTAAAVGQELICVGGTFTSLPGGLVTSVTNGVLGSGQFGCDGVVLVGTAGTSVGPLDPLTGLLGLPGFAGLSDSATLQLSPFNPRQIDVIKIQTLLSVLGGVASTTGFGDTFAAAPEPGPAMMLFSGIALIGVVRVARRRQPHNGK